MAQNCLKNGQGDGQPAALTPLQELAALSLARGRSVRQAAEHHQCGERTLRRWLAEEPAFAARVRLLRHEMTHTALALLTDGLAQAARVLRTLADAAQSESVKLGAARALFEIALKLRDQNDLAERVEQLERDAGTRYIEDAGWYSNAAHELDRQASANDTQPTLLDNGEVRHG